MNTITQAEKRALQYWSDQLSKAVQMVNKLAPASMEIGTEIESIMDDVRAINRAIVLADGQTTSFPRFEVISREPRKLELLPEEEEFIRQQNRPVNIHSVMEF